MKGLSQTSGQRSLLSKGSQLYKESGHTIEKGVLFEQGVRGLK